MDQGQVLGSLARGDDGADHLSDLDVELYVLDPAPLLDHREWYQRFGQVLVVEELEDPDWHPTRLIYYVDGKIDFMIADVKAARRSIGYTRPYRVLIDKDGLSEHLHTASDPAPSHARRLRDVHQLVLRGCSDVREMHRSR